MNTNTVPIHSWTKKITDEYKTHRQETHNALQNGSASMKKIHVAGVACTTPDIEQTTAISKNIVAEMEAETSLRNKLQKENLSYEGILPTSVWGTLLFNLKNFFTFRTLNEEGKVQANVYNEYITDNENVNNTLMVFSWVCYVALAYFIVWWTIPIVWGAGILGGFIAGVHKEDGKTEIGWPIFIGLIAPLTCVYGGVVVIINNIVKWHKNSLWPTRNDSDITSGEYIKIDLPEADITTQVRLVQWHNTGKKMYLVVHKNGFKVNVTDAERKEYKATWDPIICYDTKEKGQKLTVIIAQYGPEPAEKALMAELVQKHYKHIVTNHIMSSMN